VRKIKEALRLPYTCGLGIRRIAQSLGLSHSTVSELRGRAAAAGLGWPLPDDLDETALEASLYPGNPEGQPERPGPEWHRVQLELRRKGVTLELLWLEYRETYPDVCQYSRFCELARQGARGQAPAPAGRREDARRLGWRNGQDGRPLVGRNAA